MRRARALGVLGASGVLAGAGACAGALGRGRGGEGPAVTRLAGCYALALGRWTRGGLVAGGGAPAPLPPHVRLGAERDPEAGRGRFVLRPALAGPDVRADFTPSWEVDGGRNAVLVWPFRGGAYRLLLAPAPGDTLRGFATYTPVGLAGEYPRRAAASAVREQCPADLR